ncbi:MAG: hypothetical protein M3Z04_05485 [Chloroflexota bacterium]|nr:hypothetical protein [Chloroflexota bacterium]
MNLLSRLRVFMPIIVVALAITVSMFLTRQNAYAYTVDYRWSGNSTSYWLDSTFKNQNIGWEGSFTTAVSNWNAIPNHQFSFSGAGCGVCTSNYVYAGNPGCPNPSCYAATAKYISGGRLVQFQITLNTSTGIPFYDGTQAKTIPSNYVDLKSILRHELGHSFGLCHSFYGNSSYLMGQLPMGTTRFIDQDVTNGQYYLYQLGYAGPQPEPGGCQN